MITTNFKWILNIARQSFNTCLVNSFLYSQRGLFHSLSNLSYSFLALSHNFELMALQHLLSRKSIWTSSLLYSTGNYIQYPIVNHNAKYEKECIYICIYTHTPTNIWVYIYICMYACITESFYSIAIISRKLQISYSSVIKSMWVLPQITSFMDLHHIVDLLIATVDMPLCSLNWIFHLCCSDCRLLAIFQECYSWN